MRKGCRHVKLLYHFDEDGRERETWNDLLRMKASVLLNHLEQ